LVVQASYIVSIPRDHIGTQEHFKKNYKKSLTTSCELLSSSSLYSHILSFTPDVTYAHRRSTSFDLAGLSHSPFSVRILFRSTCHGVFETMSNSTGGHPPSTCIHQLPKLTCNYCHMENGILHIGTNDSLKISRSLGGPLPYMHPPSHLQGLLPPLTHCHDPFIKT
jgi:hypothetical protein